MKEVESNINRSFFLEMEDPKFALSVQYRRQYKDLDALKSSGISFYESVYTMKIEVAKAYPCDDLELRMVLDCKPEEENTQKPIVFGQGEKNLLALCDGMPGILKPGEILRLPTCVWEFITRQYVVDETRDRPER